MTHARALDDDTFLRGKRRSCTSIARHRRPVLASTSRRDTALSIRLTWIRLCQFMNRHFPYNEIFPRYKTERELVMTSFAIVKRKSNEPPVEPILCDRCPQRARWLVKVTAKLSLTMCGHHHDQHLAHIAAQGYDSELLDVPPPPP